MKSGIFLALTALTTLSALAQGTIYFNTRFTGAGVNAPVVLADGRGPGPAYSAGLYLKQQGSYTLIPGSITAFRDGSRTSALAQYVEPVLVEVPGAPQGATVTVRMRVWLAAEGSWESAGGSFNLRGESPDLTISNLGGGHVLPADLPSHFTGIVMGYPEPSTYALGAVGALLFSVFGQKRAS